MSWTKSWLTRAVAAVTVIGATMASLAGPADAYDRGDCERRLGAANVESVDAFKLDGGKVDFGDNAHFAGTPHGNAVVCWMPGGGVAVIGHLFADSIGETNSVAVITWYRGNSSFTTRHEHSGSFGSSKFVGEVATGGVFTKIKVELYANNVWKVSREHTR